MPPKKGGRKKNNDDGVRSSRNTKNNGGVGPSCPPPVIIDLDQETWQLRGENISIFHPELEYGFWLPCVHVAASILRCKQNLTDFVSSFYSRESMATLYEHVLYPVNGMENWPRSSEVGFELDPPNKKRQRGCPRKMRREQPQVRLHENRVESLQRTTVLSCGRYGQIGHNRRTCQNDPSGPNSQRSQASGHVSQQPDAHRDRPPRPPMETTAGPSCAASSSTHVRKALRCGRRKAAD